MALYWSGKGETCSSIVYYRLVTSNSSFHIEMYVTHFICWNVKCRHKETSQSY